MTNFQKEKTPVYYRSPKERIKNFDEVTIGYTYKEAVNEALRCLNCKDSPCVSGCPVNVPIPNFIKLLKDGKITQSYSKILEYNYFPAICGRVCPQENQCEKYCVRNIKGESVAIGRLERFVADNAQSQNVVYSNFNKNGNTSIKEYKGLKVAVIGSGPAGLSCAGYLSQHGATVEIFESLHKRGGVLTYGIPEFRLPKKIVEKEIENIIKSGVIIHKDFVVGKTITIEQMRENGFKAFFIASGAGLPNFMGIEGEALSGVCSANELLTRVNLMHGYDPCYDTPIPDFKKVVVVGGGNVAMDSARVCRRLGCEVSIIYRRSIKEMPARQEEVENAKQEGINFLTLCNPIKINGDITGKVTSVDCVKMEFTDLDKSGRMGVKPIAGSNFTLDIDGVIMAIGTSPNPLLKNSIQNLNSTKKGGIAVDSNMRTNIRDIWAGGDAVTGAATVIEAMGAGVRAAKSIVEYLDKLKN
jgi:glutamate synthase (NADPH/NADH) small chain